VVREYTSPPERLPSATGNLTDAVVSNAESDPTGIGFSRRRGDDWQGVSWAEFLADVAAVAKGLIACGIAAGDRVGLISKTRYEWVVLDYAIWFAGGVSVPLYETASADQIAWILDDSGTSLVIAETAEHVSRVDQARASGRLPALEQTLYLDGGALADLVTAGSKVTDACLEARRRAATPDTLATLIYTSGTTERPKGCRITHGNLLAELGLATSVLHQVLETDDACTLLFLPLAHVLARIVSIGCVQIRVHVGHTAEAKDLLDDLATFQPTFVLAVPRVFEKVFNTASGQAASDGRGRLFDAAVSTAIAYSRAAERGGPGMLLRSRHAVFERRVYARLRAALGGRLRYAVSGGAPLGERLAHFYRGAGVPILEGYGLTETSGAVTVNRPGSQRIGTVGQPLPGTTIRIADDGEVLVRGAQVFAGYWRDAATTADVLVDGWLHTGDVGDFDADGFVRVTGRTTEILVTAGGKSVAPAVLEDRVRESPLVSQCMVIGDGRPFLAALVTLDRDGVVAWLATRRRSGAPSTLTDDPEVRAEIQRAVDDANATVSRAEAIRAFSIVAGDWTEASGELTPTRKLRRSVVQRRHHADIELLYP
jgi:long-chain acyl-CoA synthetase